jgi:hypothetical protein
LQDRQDDFALRTGTADEPGAADKRLEAGKNVGESVHRFHRKIAVNDPKSSVL